MSLYIGMSVLCQHRQGISTLVVMEGMNGPEAGEVGREVDARMTELLGMCGARGAARMR